MTEPDTPTPVISDTSGVADIVPSKPAPRECKNSRELKAHYPTLADYLAVVDAAELHHFQFEDSSVVGHAYYQKGFQTIGEHFDTIIRAFAANACAGEREYVASELSAKGNSPLAQRAWKEVAEEIRSLPPQGEEI